MADDSNKQQRGTIPKDWHYTKEIFEGVFSTEIRAFPKTNPASLPIAILSDRKLFERMLLSLRDFKHASSAASFILDEIFQDKTYSLSDLRQLMCYETTLVVSYCRPFTKSTAGYPQLSFNKLGIKLSPFTRSLHDTLMERRNQIFAHSDVGKVEYGGVQVIQSKLKDGKDFSMLMGPHFDEGLSLGVDQIHQVDILVLSLMETIRSTLQCMHGYFAGEYPSFNIDIS